MNYIKSFIKYELICIFEVLLCITLVYAAGAKPEYIPLAFGVTPIFAAMMTMSTHTASKKS